MKHFIEGFSFMAIFMALFFISGAANPQTTTQCVKPVISVEADCYKAVITWTHDGKYAERFDLTRDGKTIVSLDMEARSYTDRDVKQGESYEYCIIKWEVKSIWR